MDRYVFAYYRYLMFLVYIFWQIEKYIWTHEDWER